MPGFFFELCPAKNNKSMDIKKQRVYSAPFALFEKEPDSKGYLLEEREYDKDGNLLKVVRFFEDGSKDEEATYKYDDKGRMTEERVFYALSDTIDLRKINYDDEQHTEEEIYYYGDEEGERTITKKNEANESLEIRRLDEEGQLVKKELYEYHQKDKPTLEAEYTGEGVMLKEVRSEYDDQDRLVKQHIKSSDEMEIDQTLEITHEEGKEIAKAYGEDGEWLYTRTRHYNDDGNLQQFEHEDASTGEKTIQAVTYDEKGNPTLVEWRNGEGDLMRKQETKFNEEGQMESEFFFDLNPMTGRQSHMVTSYEYEYYQE